MVIEYCERKYSLFLTLVWIVGDLSGQIKNQKGQFQEPQVVAVVAQACDALAFTHSKGILHRDIKPDNILVKKNGEIKLTDYGLATVALKDQGTQYLHEAIDAK